MANQNLIHPRNTLLPRTQEPRPLRKAAVNPAQRPAGKPARKLIGEAVTSNDALSLSPPVARARHPLGLDLPLGVQYGRYLAGILHGDLGESFRFQQPVLRVVASHYPATLELAIVALFVCAAIGIPA